ncbi:PAS domain-containing protein [Methylobacterium nigriterrae]|uniref:PAS domain-containing protein n=1 Tax=Methylobacterium nigriterrae TaxID=3127512 RepID=UPI0030134A61
MHSDDSDYVLDPPDKGWNYEPSRAELFKQIKSPAYTTDADGWLTYYNEAAADLWGYRPELSKTRWCGSWRIFTVEGAHLPLDQCPMAVALKEGRAVRGVQAVLERPDGTLIPFMPHPTPLRDASGAVLAGSNVLLPLTSPTGPVPFDLPGDAWAGALPADLPDGLELDDLTGCLQMTLAAQADVEFGFRIDCERLETWSGSEAEKERIVRQLEGKRQRQCNLLQQRLDLLQQRAREIMSRDQIGGAAIETLMLDPRNILH